MGRFYQSVDSVFEFENGYQVFMEAKGIAPYSIFTHVWHTGFKIPLEIFVSNTMNGFFTADEFARLLFKISKAEKPPIKEEDD